jgi:hypothetical protein
MKKQIESLIKKTEEIINKIEQSNNLVDSFQKLKGDQLMLITYQKRKTTTLTNNLLKTINTNLEELNGITTDEITRDLAKELSTLCTKGQSDLEKKFWGPSSKQFKSITNVIQRLHTRSALLHHRETFNKSEHTQLMPNKSIEIFDAATGKAEQATLWQHKNGHTVIYWTQAGKYEGLNPHLYNPEEEVIRHFEYHELSNSLTYHEDNSKPEEIEIKIFNQNKCAPSPSSSSNHSNPSPTSVMNHPSSQTTNLSQLQELVALRFPKLAHTQNSTDGSHKRHAEAMKSKSSSNASPLSAKTISNKKPKPTLKNFVCHTSNATSNDPIIKRTCDL